MDLTLKYYVFKYYTLFLAALFLIKIVYYFLSMFIWCHSGIDPHKKFVKRRFKLMVSLGLYQFLLFITGIILYIQTADTQDLILNRLRADINTSQTMNWFVFIFSILLAIHASLFSLYFTFYMLFIGAVYYYFNVYDGFTLYATNQSEF